MFDTNSKISNHSHPTMEVGHEDALARVYAPVSVVAVPVWSASFGDAESGRPEAPVQHIFRVRYDSQIGNSVVKSIAIDVVNLLGLDAVIHEVRNAMSRVFRPMNLDVPVFSRTAPSNLPDVGFLPWVLVGKNARIGVIGEKIVNTIRNALKCFSHIAPPCGLVRGLTVGAVSTPILPQGATS